MFTMTFAVHPWDKSLASISEFHQGHVSYI